MSCFNLDNTVTIVVGGLSGIGRGIAEAFVKNNSKVIIVDINKNLWREVKKDLKGNKKNEIYYYYCDVSKYQKVKSICEKIYKKFSYIDNLIYSAGYGSKSTIENITIDEWEKSISINLNGAFYFLKCLINQMILRKKGNIIIIGSSTVINGGGGGIHYAASKTGLYGIVKGLSYELLPKGIRTNIITPAVIDTPMLRKRYPNTMEINKTLSDQIPIGRIGLPKDIANIALFLASDLSEYICGVDIIADGGRMLYRHPMGS